MQTPGAARRSVFAPKPRDDLVPCKHCQRNFAEDRVRKSQNHKSFNGNEMLHIRHKVTRGWKIGPDNILNHFEASNLISVTIWFDSDLLFTFWKFVKYKRLCFHFYNPLSFLTESTINNCWNCNNCTLIVCFENVKKKTKHRKKFSFCIERTHRY